MLLPNPSIDERALGELVAAHNDGNPDQLRFAPADGDGREPVPGYVALLNDLARRSKGVRAVICVAYNWRSPVEDLE